MQLRWSALEVGATKGIFGACRNLEALPLVPHLLSSDTFLACEAQVIPIHRESRI